MALATTCPSCKTSFKVASDQLKLRRGMVRCGVCQLVFSGVEYLRYVSDQRPVDANATAGTATGATEADDLALENLKTAFFLPETQFDPTIAPMAGHAPVRDLTNVDRAPDAARRRKRRLTGTPPVPPQAGSPDWPGLPQPGADWHAPTVPGPGRPTSAGSMHSAPGGGQVGAAPPSTMARPDESGHDSADPDAWATTTPWPEQAPARPADASQLTTPPVPTSLARPTQIAVAVGRTVAQARVTTAVPDSSPARDGVARVTPGSPMIERQPDPSLVGHAVPGPLAAETGFADDEEEAIDFFGRTSNPVFDFDLPPRGVWIAAGLLALVLMLQVVIGARDVLAARMPAAQGLIRLLSAPLGLQVSLPINAEAISIESFDLARPRAGARQPMTRYSMNMLLRNRASHPLRWPSIELTLTDSTGGILVRKVLSPTDYLRDEVRVRAGMAGASEEAIRLDLAADKIVPSGYSAILFYH